VDASSHFRPRDCLGQAGIDSLEACPDFRRPRRLSVRVDFGIKTLDELAGESGSLFCRKLKRLIKQFLGIHGQKVTTVLSVRSAPGRLVSHDAACSGNSPGIQRAANAAGKVRNRLRQPREDDLYGVSDHREIGSNWFQLGFELCFEPDIEPVFKPGEFAVEPVLKPGEFAV